MCEARAHISTLAIAARFGVTIEGHIVTASAPSRHSVAAGVATVCSLVAALSIWLPWARVGLGGNVTLYTGSDMPAVATLIVVLSIASAICAGCSRGRPASGWQDAAVLASICSALVTGTMLLVIEIMSALISPSWFVPEPIKRLTVDVRAGVGLWVALFGCVAAIVVLRTALLEELLRALEARSESMRRRVAITGGALFAAVAVIAWLRYEPWVGASVDGHHIGVSAWALPWAGPMSLAALGCVVAALVALSTLHFQVAALLACLGGWVLSLSAALAVISAGTLADVPFTRAIPNRYDHYSPSLGGGAAAWAAFALGLAVAGAGAALLTREIASSGRGPWRA